MFKFKIISGKLDLIYDVVNCVENIYLLRKKWECENFVILDCLLIPVMVICLVVDYRIFLNKRNNLMCLKIKQQQQPQKYQSFNKKKKIHAVRLNHCK